LTSTIGAGITTVHFGRLPADVVRCWLKTISTSGRVEHYTLSRNYPEIQGLSTTPSRQVDEGSVSRPESSDSILSALSTFTQPLCQTTTTFVAISISI